MKRSQAIFCASVAIVSTVFAQTTRPPLQPSAGMVSGIAPLAAADDQASTLASAQQTAQIFGLDRKIQRVRELQAERGAPSLTEEERSLRLELLESIQVAILDVDAVLGEISNERNQLGDLRASLQRRRDKSVGRFTTAALLTGSGVGIAVNATQYSSFSTRTNNAGDTLGIVSGAASMILSVMAARRQKGPNGSVGDVPNMLAPLLGGAPVLNTFYPRAVLEYLQNVPPDDVTHGTRLDQLKQSWIKSGRLDWSSAKTEQQTTAIVDL